MLTNLDHDRLWFNTHIPLLACSQLVPHFITVAVMRLVYRSNSKPGRCLWQGRASAGVTAAAAIASAATATFVYIFNTPCQSRDPFCRDFPRVFRLVALFRRSSPTIDRKTDAEPNGIVSGRLDKVNTFYLSTAKTSYNKYLSEQSTQTHNACLYMLNCDPM